MQHWWAGPAAELAQPGLTGKTLSSVGWNRPGVGEKRQMGRLRQAGRWGRLGGRRARAGDTAVRPGGLLLLPAALHVPLTISGCVVLKDVCRAPAVGGSAEHEYVEPAW